MLYLPYVDCKDWQAMCGHAKLGCLCSFVPIVYQVFFAHGLSSPTFHCETLATKQPASSPLPLPPPPLPSSSPSSSPPPSLPPSLQPTNQPTNHPASQPASQPTSQPTNQPTNRPTNQPTSNWLLAYPNRREEPRASEREARLWLARLVPCGWPGGGWSLRVDRFLTPGLYALFWADHFSGW